MQRKQDQLEVKDWCAHTETRVSQMGTQLQEEVAKMVQHSKVIEGLESLALKVADDLNAFSLQFTAVNDETRQLLIDD